LKSWKKDKITAQVKGSNQQKLMLASRIYELESFGADGRPKTVKRQYRDFLELHNFLIDKFLAKFIECPFPEKSIFKKFEDRSLKL
jgi:hypothetical protein